MGVDSVASLRALLEGAVGRGTAKLGEERMTGGAEGREASSRGAGGESPAVTYSSVASKARVKSKRITPTPSNVSRERKESNLFASASTDDGTPRSTESSRRRQMFDAISAFDVPALPPSRPAEAGRVGAELHRTLQPTKPRAQAASSPPDPVTRSIARDHAHDLALGRCPSVLRELRTLFEAVGLHGVVDPSCLEFDCPGPSPSSSPTRCYAPAYSCLVLLEASEVTLATGERALEALAESPAVRLFAPELMARVAARLAELKSTRTRYDKAYDEVPCSGSAPPAYLRRPMVLPGGETRPLNLMPEDAKRLKNREEARDSFVSLLGSLQDFLARQELLNTRIDRELGGRAGGNKGSRGGGDYESLHSRVRAFVSTLHIDNVTWFSQLFLERILQTASMGEVDEEVATLASADPSKMRRLHQRMTLPHARGKGHRGAAFGVQDYRGGGNRFTEGAPSGKGPHHHHRAVAMTQLNGLSGMEMVRTVLVNFPTNLRIYVLFLLVADSHRLCGQLQSKMLGRISEIATWVSSPQLPSDISERVLSCKSLSLFLGYFAFCAKGKACALPRDALERLEGDREGASGFVTSASALDTSALIDRSLDLGSLPFTLPWVADYLRFGRYAEEGADGELRGALARVWSIRGALSGERGHTTASLCMRACVDTLLEDWRLNPLDERVAKVLGGPQDKLSRLQVSIDLANKAMDQKCLQACCPELDDLAGIISQRSASAPAKKSSRKITPVSPAAPSPGPARAAPGDLNIEDNTELRRALLGWDEPGAQRNRVLTLQRALLDRYPELKSAVDFVVDAVARNAVDEVISTTVWEECLRIVASHDASTLLSDETHVRASHLRLALASSGKIKAFVSEKVAAALEVLVPPGTDSQVSDCAVKIGTQASLITAAKRLLDRIPLEYQKCAREKAKGPADAAKRRLGGAYPPLVSETSVSGLGDSASRILETTGISLEVKVQESVADKLRGACFQLNACLNVVKVKATPLVPRTDEFHSLWKCDSSVSEALQLLGYVWNDFTSFLASHGGQEQRDLFTCARRDIFDRLEFGSDRPVEHFAAGVVSRFADACSFRRDGVLDEAGYDTAESCSVKILSSLVGAGLLRPVSLQGVLLRLLDDPRGFCQYSLKAASSEEHSGSHLQLCQHFASKCLEDKVLLEARICFARLSARLG